MTLLEAPVGAPALPSRAVGERLRAMEAEGELDLPLPGDGDTARRWAALAAWGREDLPLARLAEGHTDALAILAEAGRTPVAGALYGVWAARSGGTGAEFGWDGRLAGTVRFCSGAGFLDRALVAARQGESTVLVEVDLTDPRIHRDPQSWQPIGMADSDSPDVTFDQVPVATADVVGAPGFYLDRPGFAYGGAGVAAAWLGGSVGMMDLVTEYLSGSRSIDDHQYAHVGALHAELESADAVLSRAAERCDAVPRRDFTADAALCRSVVEHAAREVLDRVPRIVGPTPLCRDRRFGQRLADLGVYVRQHHGERDLAALGRSVLSSPR